MALTREEKGGGAEETEATSGEEDGGGNGDRGGGGRGGQWQQRGRRKSGRRWLRGRREKEGGRVGEGGRLWWRQHGRQRLGAACDSGGARVQVAGEGWDLGLYMWYEGGKYFSNSRANSELYPAEAVESCPRMASDFPS